MPALGIDTATARGSIALAAEGRVLAASALEERAWHARELLKRIDRLLRDGGLGPGDLSGIGVAVGPGSFTGVRIGMATAKGLAYALRIGLRGLSTLEALARAAAASLSPAPEWILPTLGAGRGEVYAALFRLEAAGPSRQAEDRSRPPEELARDLPPGCVVIGDGAEAVLRSGAEAGRSLKAAPAWPPLAPAIALWAWSAIPPGAGYTPGALGPNYVRPSDAEAARRRS